MFTNIVPVSKMFNRMLGGLYIVNKSFGSMILSNAPLCTNATICLTKQTFNSGYSLHTACKYCSSVDNSNGSANSQGKPYYNPNTTMEELEAILKADPEKHKRYKILQLEVDIMRQNGAFLPEDIKPYRWLELLDLKSITARRRLLNFLSLLEAKKRNQKEKKEKARIIREETKQNESSDDETAYKLYRNSMFLRIYESTINHYYNGRLFQAMQYNPKIVVDCSYHTAMTLRENYECGKQLSLLFACNRIHPDPFDIHFCNVDKSSAMMRKFNRIIPPAYDPSFPLNIHEESYTQLFDKQNLVYLTPHCNTVMTEYDASSVYIIGAMVDKTNSDPLSLAKAKKEGLKMAKLPFEKYLLWGTGASKRLPLNQILSILLDLKLTGDWEKAFRHVPRRKLERNPTDAFIQSQSNVSDSKYSNYNRQQASSTSEYTNHESFSFASRQKKTLYK